MDQADKRQQDKGLRITGTWTINDLMDLEFFLYHEMSHTDNAKSAERDQAERAYYLRHILPALEKNPHKKNNRRFTLRAWLDFQRHRESTQHEGLLPGAVFHQVYGFVLFLSIVSGFFTGTGLCFSFLTYQGHEPINVASYLGLFVLSQLFILMIAAGFLIWSKTFHRAPPFSLIRFMLKSLMVRLMTWLNKKSSRHLPSEQKNQYESAWGLLKGKSRLYGSVFPWPLVILSQVFALFFNLGLIVATVLRVIGSDLAFGWQSTVQLSSQAVYDTVRLIATPWSFVIGSPLAHPSLAQIEGSRMILKDGITRLATQDLVSWWPFLCFCVFFYGLLPRLAILVYASVLKQKTLGRLNFENMACDMVMTRLTSPMLSSRGEHQLPPPGPGFVLTNSPCEPLKPEPDKTIVALVPEDIGAACGDHELNAHLTRIFGTAFSHRVPVSFDAIKDQAVLSPLFSSMKNSWIVFIMEAWQPPIKEILEYIRNLKQTADPQLRIHILLIGKPSTETIFTRPDEMDARLWVQKINGLSDPCIRAHEVIS